MDPLPGRSREDLEAAETPEAAVQDASAEPGHDIVVIGASAGGVDALKRLVGALPASLPASLFVVLHARPDAPSLLQGILAQAGALPVRSAEDGMPIERGRIYVAPRDAHLLLEPDRLVVVHGPRESRHRPAIDPLFRSAAWAYGPRVVGVVLSGGLDDGTAGLWAIKSCGGTTIVQDPADARHPEMPLNALLHNRVDHRLPLDGIAPELVRLATSPVRAHAGPPDRASLAIEVDFARFGGSIAEMSRLGTLSPFTCPSCRGALWELDQGGHLRYRCHTGHAFSQNALVIEQGSAMEDALYTALRAVEEKATALRRISERWPDRYPTIAHQYEERARALDRTAEQLRAMLAGSEG